jgi:hypothetical protein
VMKWVTIVTDGKIMLSEGFCCDAAGLHLLLTFALLRLFRGNFLTST